MTQIKKGDSVVTFINVFTMEPVNQPRVVELLTSITQLSVRNARGFVSASLHRSLDGTKVTMYAQWQTPEDYEALRRDPTPAQALQEVLRLAAFDPGMYEVVESFERTP